MAAYLRSLKWFHIPVGVGLSYLCYQQFRHTREREQRKLITKDPAELVAKDWQVICRPGRNECIVRHVVLQVNFLASLPTRLFSRLWGRMSDLKLPVWCRKPLFGLYVYVYKCNMDEAEVGELKSYQSINSFFTRRLKSGVRPVNDEHELVIMTY